MSEEKRTPELWEVAWLAADSWFAKHGWFDPEDAWTEDSDDAPDHLRSFLHVVAVAIAKAVRGVGDG